MTARFEAGRVTGFAGCNTFTGPYTLKGNRLTVGVLAGTMMACPEPAMSLERAFHAALTGTLSYAIAGDRLSLTAASGAVLAFEKEAAVTPEGGPWEVTGFNNGRQAVVSPMVGTVLTVAFENGVVSGQSGCNTFRATYSTTGDRITIGPAASTRMMCGADVMTQEQQFLKALESATTWIVRRRLAPPASRRRRARDGRAASQVLTEGFAPRTPRHALSRAASSARSVRVAHFRLR